MQTRQDDPGGHGPQPPVDGRPEPPPRPTSNRQLVVCLDGTNNTLTAGMKDTNVLQLYEILRHQHDVGQGLYYDPGVGSASALPPTGVSGFVTEPLRRVAGLALGSGVYDNIGQAYLYLCREYGRLDPVDATSTLDEIYLFGFSRGAFTARAVAGMVNLFGLLRPEHDVLLPTLLRVYFSGEPNGAAPLRAATRGLQRLRVAMDPVPSDIAGAAPGHAKALTQVGRADVAAQIRANFTTAVGAGAVVHFVGVWDTVDSVGLPGLRKRITSSATITGKRFRHVRHALALDEHRRQFLPRPYVGTPEPGRPDVDPGQTLKQLWFRGVHTDIGGGRPIELTRMSSETMHWMVTEARSVGLRCPDVPVATDPLPEIIGDQLRAQPLWALTGMAVRDPRQAPAGTIDAAGDVLAPGAPVYDAGRFTPDPLEHPSAVQLTPAAPGAPATSPPASPWAAGKGPRVQAWLTPLLVAVVLAVVGWTAAGATVTPGPLHGDLGAALGQGARLSAKQVTTFPWPPSAAHELARQARADRPGHHASFGWAMVFALSFVLAAAVVLARLVARAFGRLTMWRSVGDPSPRWGPGAAGLGYPLLVLGALGQGAAVILAWKVGDSFLRAIFLGLATVSSAVALGGAVLVAWLVLRWLVREIVPGAARRA
ncbi:MAG: DUF2235 domain-containing protein [Solirubrobacteraceae bacterium]